MDKKKLLRKFISNQCNSSEAEQVSRLLNQEPHLLDELLSEEEWNSYLINYEQTTADKKISWGTILVLFCFFSFSTISFLHNSQPSDKDLVTSSNKDFFFNASDDEVELTLADGSTIRLQSKSAFHASINEQYPIRYVNLLSGEMHIKVKKDYYKPFVAQSGATHVTALGTEFTLKHDASHDYSYVGLHEGKLKVNLNKKQAEKIILRPGEQVVYVDTKLELTTNDQLIIPPNINHTSVKQGVYTRPSSITVDNSAIQMHQTKLSEALSFISHELDMPIAYSPEDVEGYHITGMFVVPDADMDINMKEVKANEILNIITSVNPLTLQQKHDTNILLIKN